MENSANVYDRSSEDSNNCKYFLTLWQQRSRKLYEVLWGAGPTEKNFEHILMKSKAHTTIAQLKIQVRDPIDVRMKGYIFSLLIFVCFTELFKAWHQSLLFRQVFSFQRGCGWW